MCQIYNNETPNVLCLFPICIKNMCHNFEIIKSSLAANCFSLTLFVNFNFLF